MVAFSKVAVLAAAVGAVRFSEPHGDKNSDYVGSETVDRSALHDCGGGVVKGEVGAGQSVATRQLQNLVDSVEKAEIWTPDSATRDGLNSMQEALDDKIPVRMDRHAAQDCEEGDGCADKKVQDDAPYFKKTPLNNKNYVGKNSVGEEAEDAFKKAIEVSNETKRKYLGQQFAGMDE